MEKQPNSTHRVALSAPVLMLVTGVAGTGKTTLAKKLAERVWAVFLEKDELQNPFTRSREGEFYKRYVHQQSYEALWNIALSNLREGTPVIVDAPLVKEMLDPAWHKEMENRFVRVGFPILLIHCEATPSVIRKRLSCRGEERDNAILRNFSAFLDEQPIQVAIPWPHLRVDTEHPLEVQLAETMQFLLAQLQRKVPTPTTSSAF